MDASVPASEPRRCGSLLDRRCAGSPLALTGGATDRLDRLRRDVCLAGEAGAFVKRARSLALNCLCALLSLAAALAACEAALRLFHPRYHHAAEARREPDAQRIWKPPPNSHYRYPHPDTGRLHRVMHNNLGARQHRNFHPEDLEGAVNLAFFGDSFAENLRLPAQYSFEEVLDFLLNASAEADGRSAHRFNALNFGVDGYGTGQEYILYRDVRAKAPLHHVFYLFYGSDVGDVRRNGIHFLDESGRLVERLPPKTPLWVRALARVHLTYLAMDGWERLRREWLERFPFHGKTRGAGDAGEDSPGPPSENVTDRDAIRLWRAVVLRWQREVENSGAGFTVVSLPDTRHMQHALASLPDSVETLSLWDCFRSTVSDPPPRHMLRFEEDEHWNEAANMVAAHCLYRFLEERLGLPPASDEALARERHRYYRAFAEAPDWEGGRWMPEPPWALPGAPSASGGGAIVEKYLALERSPARLDEHWRRVVRSAKAEGPLVRAAWDVYAAWDQRLLVYIKKPCRDEDLKPLFFIHLYPTNREAARGLTIRSSSTTSEFVDLRRFFTICRKGDECVVGFQLPAWGISRARTGQFVRTADDGGDGTRTNNVWTAELALRRYPD